VHTQVLDPAMKAHGLAHMAVKVPDFSDYGHDDEWAYGGPRHGGAVKGAQGKSCQRTLSI